MSEELSEKILEGLTFSRVRNNKNKELIFTCVDGRKWKFYHKQDCCEEVLIEDICGDLKDLQNTPILEIAIRVSENHELVKEKGFISNIEYHDYNDQFWTFYRITTRLGTAVIRWYGTCNGSYYSTAVDFCEVKK